ALAPFAGLAQPQGGPAKGGEQLPPGAFLRLTMTNPKVAHGVTFTRPVVFSPDGKLLALARLGEDGSWVTVWDARIGEEQKTLHQPGMGVRDFAFLPGGHALISASWSSTLVLWNLKTGQPVFTYDKNPAEMGGFMVLAPDGRTLVYP